MIRPRRLGFTRSSLAVLATLALVSSLGKDALGGVVLLSASTSSITYSVNNLDRTNANLPGSPFLNNVLIYPGTSAYPVVTTALIQQPTVFKVPPMSSNKNYTQTTKTDGTLISSTSYGSGSISTTLSSSVPGNGSVAGNAGVSYNPGSFVSSSANHPLGQDVAVVGIATSFATFRVTANTTLTPGVFLDVAGYVNGGPGNFVAVGLSGSISLTSPLSSESTVTNNFQLVGAYAGAGTQITPANGNFNNTSPPAGFQFEAIGDVIFPQFAVTLVDSILTIQSTMTLIADPDSMIQLLATRGPGPGQIIPDFGVYVGGPVGSNDLVSTPEPATLLGLIVAAPLLGLLYRRHHATRRVA